MSLWALSWALLLAAVSADIFTDSLGISDERQLTITGVAWLPQQGKSLMAGASSHETLSRLELEVQGPFSASFLYTQAHNGIPCGGVSPSSEGWFYHGLEFDIIDKAQEGLSVFRAFLPQASGWSTFSYTIPAGVYTLRWQYRSPKGITLKASNPSIANVTIPPFRCLTDEYADGNGKCVSCPSGQFNAMGDDRDGPATTCDDCGAGQHLDPIIAPTTLSPTTLSPTEAPTLAPSKVPTVVNFTTVAPTGVPTTNSPTIAVTGVPTRPPTEVNGTHAPTTSEPTSFPTSFPTSAPTPIRGMCVDCPAGSNPSRRDWPGANNFDTTCECAPGYRVLSGACVVCPAGRYAPGFKDPYAGDTPCVTVDEALQVNTTSVTFERDRWMVSEQSVSDGFSAAFQTNSAGPDVSSLSTMVHVGTDQTLTFRYAIDVMGIGAFVCTGTKLEVVVDGIVRLTLAETAGFQSATMDMSATHGLHKLEFRAFYEGGSGTALFLLDELELPPLTCATDYRPDGAGGCVPCAANTYKMMGAIASFPAPAGVCGDCGPHQNTVGGNCYDCPEYSTPSVVRADPTGAPTDCLCPVGFGTQPGCVPCQDRAYGGGGKTSVYSACTTFATALGVLPSQVRFGPGLMFDDGNGANGARWVVQRESPGGVERFFVGPETSPAALEVRVSSLSLFQVTFAYKTNGGACPLQFTMTKFNGGVAVDACLNATSWTSYTAVASTGGSFTLKFDVTSSGVAIDSLQLPAQVCAMDNFADGTGACAPCASGTFNKFGDNPNPVGGVASVTECDDCEAYVHNGQCSTCLSDPGPFSSGPRVDPTAGDTPCECEVFVPVWQSLGACSCPKDHHVSNERCVPCPTSVRNATDDVEAGDTSCSCMENFRVQAHVCVPCSDSTRVAGDQHMGPDTHCACNENFHVVDNECVACVLSTRPAGDDQGGADTFCACQADHSVVDKQCVACPAGTVRLAGDHIGGSATTCVDVGTAVGLSVSHLRSVDASMWLARREDGEGSDGYFGEQASPNSYLQFVTADQAISTMSFKLRQNGPDLVPVPVVPTLNTSIANSTVAQADLMRREGIYQIAVNASRDSLADLTSFCQTGFSVIVDGAIDAVCTPSVLSTSWCDVSCAIAAGVRSLELTIAQGLPFPVLIDEMQLASPPCEGTDETGLCEPCDSAKHPSCVLHTALGVDRRHSLLMKGTWGISTFTGGLSRPQSVDGLAVVLSSHGSYVELVAQGPGEVSFYAWASQTSVTSFRVTIDDETALLESVDVWTRYAFDLPVGEHTIRVQFQGSVGSLYLDLLQLPPLRCPIDMRASGSGTCVPCAAGSYSAGGALVDGGASTCSSCAPGQRVAGGTCVTCMANSNTAARHSPTGSDTKCLCDMDMYVSAGACLPCVSAPALEMSDGLIFPFGTLNVAGDDPAMGDTVCPGYKVALGLPADYNDEDAFNDIFGSEWGVSHNSPTGLCLATVVQDLEVVSNTVLEFSVYGPFTISFSFFFDAGDPLILATSRLQVGGVDFGTTTTTSLDWDTLSYDIPPGLQVVRFLVDWAPGLNETTLSRPMFFLNQLVLPPRGCTIDFRADGEGGCVPCASGKYAAPGQLPLGPVGACDACGPSAHVSSKTCVQCSANNNLDTMARLDPSAYNEYFVTPCLCAAGFHVSPDRTCVSCELGRFKLTAGGDVDGPLTECARISMQSNPSVVAAGQNFDVVVQTDTLLASYEYNWVTDGGVCDSAPSKGTFTLAEERYVAQGELLLRSLLPEFTPAGAYRLCYRATSAHAWILVEGSVTVGGCRAMRLLSRTNPIAGEVLPTSFERALTLSQSGMDQLELDCQLDPLVNLGDLYVRVVNSEHSISARVVALDEGIVTIELQAWPATYCQNLEVEVCTSSNCLTPLLDGLMISFPQPAFVPSSLRVADSAWSQDAVPGQVWAASRLPQYASFELTAFPVHTGVSLRVGRRGTNEPSVPCLDMSVNRTGVNPVVMCTIPTWFDPLMSDRDLRIWLDLSCRASPPFAVSQSSSSDDTLHYPVPSVEIVCVDAECRSASDAKDIPIAGALLTLVGADLYSPVTVSIGDTDCPIQSYLGNAAVSTLVNSTSNTVLLSGVSCRVPPGLGADHTLTVLTGDLIAEPAWTISYAAASGELLRGCNSNVSSALELVGCPRVGGEILTLQGNDFGPDATALVDGVPCEVLVTKNWTVNNETMLVNVTRNATYLECMLPSGTGARVAVSVQQVGGRLGMLGYLTYVQCMAGYEPNTTVPLECVPCAPGTAKMSAGQRACERCSLNTYNGSAAATRCSECPLGSVAATNNTQCQCQPTYELNGDACLPCSEGFDCSFNARRDSPRLVNGYKLVGSAAVACPAFEACRDGQCVGPYSGPLCTDCAPEHGQQSSQAFVCDQCDSVAVQTVFVLLIFILVVAMTGFVIIQSDASSITKASENDSHCALLALLKVGMTTMQINSIAMLATRDSLDFAWDLLNVERIMSSAGIAALNFDCLVGTGSPFLAQCLFFLIIPLFAPLVSLIFTGAFVAIRSKLNGGDPYPPSDEFKQLIVCGTVFQWFAFYPFIVRTAFLGFKCTTVGGANLLLMDMSLECFGPEHAGYAWGVSLPTIIVWVVLMPALLFLVIWRERDDLHQNDVRRKFSILFTNVRPGAFYWETTMFARKLLLTLFAVTLIHEDTHGPVASICCVLVMLVACLAHAHIRPFAADAVLFNRLEGVSLCISLLTFIFLALGGATVESNRFIFNLGIFLINALFLICLVVVGVWMTLSQRRQKAQNEQSARMRAEEAKASARNLALTSLQQATGSSALEMTAEPSSGRDFTTEAESYEQEQEEEEEESYHEDAPAASAGVELGANFQSPTTPYPEDFVFSPPTSPPPSEEQE